MEEEKKKKKKKMMMISNYLHASFGRGAKRSAAGGRHETAGTQ